MEKKEAMNFKDSNERHMGKLGGWEREYGAII